MELAHVGDVEEAGLLTHRLVLADVAGVAHRHLEAGEGDDPGPGGLVESMERGAAHGVGSLHGTLLEVG